MKKCRILLCLLLLCLVCSGCEGSYGYYGRADIPPLVEQWREDVFSIRYKYRRIFHEEVSHGILFLIYIDSKYHKKGGRE